MTDSENKDGGGLPTAAYKVTAEREHLDSDIEVVKKNRPQHHREDIDQVDELVRRSDVKALIQDKIDRLGIENPHSNWRKEELKELLEELEQ